MGLVSVWATPHRELTVPLGVGLPHFTGEATEAREPVRNPTAGRGGAGVPPRLRSRKLMREARGLSRAQASVWGAKEKLGAFPLGPQGGPGQQGSLTLVASPARSPSPSVPPHPPPPVGRTLCLQPHWPLASTLTSCERPCGLGPGARPRGGPVPS